jgi:hypothetical protein
MEKQAQAKKLTHAEIFDMLPDDQKVTILMRNGVIMAKMIQDIHLNIQNFGLMKKGTLAYQDFYSKWNMVFPNKKVEL